MSVNENCVQNIEFGVDVVYLPPAQLLISTNGSTELPTQCRQQPTSALQSRHKIAPAFWDFVEHVNSGVGNRYCNPKEQASHQCVLVHPTHPEHLVAVEVHLLQVQPFSPNISGAAAAMSNSRSAQAAADEWPPMLQRHLGAPVAMEALDALLVVYVQPRHLTAAAQALARQPAVAIVQPRRVQFLHNLMDVSIQLQTSGATGGGTTTSDAQFWAAGVNGSGQIIGLGDSGIDMKHCAFVDAVVPFDSFTVDRSRVPVFRNMDHRKVSLYYMCSPCPPSVTVLAAYA